MNTFSRGTVYRVALLASCAAAFGAVPAYAQDAETAVAEEGGIGDIVVTAQRRSEKLQDVPIAITALTGDTLTAQGISSTDSLQLATPGLVMNRQLLGSAPYLRGVGSDSSLTPGFEAPVATYIDGVYVGAAGGAVMNLSSVERVEVLRGPQGTLFGRNATGGAINVTTRTPSSDPSAEASLSYGSYQTVEGSFYATGGSEKVAADIAGYVIDQGRGFGFNPTQNTRINTLKTWSLRSKIRFAPTENDTFTLMGDYTKDRSTLGLVLTSPPGTILLDGLGRDNAPGNYDARGDFPTKVDTTIWGVGLTYEHNFDWGSFKSITAYRDVNLDYQTDYDLTPIPIVHGVVTIANQSFQQELLLNGETGKLKWTTGFFYYNANDKFDPLTILGVVDRYTKQGNRSYSAYAQGTYALGESTNFTAGIRYTIDQRDFSSKTFAQGTSFMVAQFSGDKTFKKPTWRLSLDHRFSPDVLAYVSYNRGFKSGAFDANTDSQNAVKPETLDSYETGLKTELFDRQVRFNVAAFYYDYKNLQVILGKGDGTSDTINVPSARIKGGEIELLFVPRISFGDLSVNVGVSILDGHYRSFANGYTTTPLPTGGNVITQPVDLSGNRMVRAPKWTSTVSASYSIPTGFGEVGVNANWYHNDGFLWSVDGRARQTGYDVVNAQAYVAFGQNERFKLRVFAKNLTNDQYMTQYFPVGSGDFGTYSPPRTYGVGINVKI